MRRTLLVLRHGKSDWNASYGGDHERPLAPRGRRAAAAVGRFLSAAGVAPEMVLSSTAVRARTTVELAARAGGWQCPVVETEQLYGASAAGVLERIGEVPAAVGTLLVSGHQPTWAELIAALTGARVRFPTAALACIRCELEGWEGLAAARDPELAWLVTPKLLAACGST